MTHDDVSRIERELGITVPEDYRALVTDYPAELWKHVSDFDLLDDPSGVIEINREVRTGDFYDLTWPEEYFAIGETRRGDYYCLDLSNDASPVIYFDHEAKAFLERAPSLQEWWPKVVEEYGGG